MRLGFWFTPGRSATSGHTWAAECGENPAKEYLQFYWLGVDGLFSDFPDTAVSTRGAPRAMLGLSVRIVL